MKLKIKQMIDKQWSDIQIERLCSVPPIDFLISEKLPTVATIYNSDNPIFFISNSKETVNKLSSKLPGFFAKDFKLILSSNPAIGIELATIFQGSLLTSTEV